MECISLDNLQNHFYLNIHIYKMLEPDRSNINCILTNQYWQIITKEKYKPENHLFGEKQYKD